MTVHLRIVTNRNLVYDGVADEVVAPGFLGEFGVLPRHEQFLTLVRPGRVLVHVGDKVEGFVVGTGFAEAGPDRLTLLTDYCEKLSAVNLERSTESLHRAESVLARSEDGSADWIHAEREAAIARAWLMNG